MPPAPPDRATNLHRWTSCLLLVGALGGAAVLPASAQIRELAPAVAAKPTPEAEKAAAELGIGSWIWTTNFADQQSCRLWRAFTLPDTNRVLEATFRITADNLYRFYLDGRAIGEGGNWRSLTEYDLKWEIASLAAVDRDRLPTRRGEGLHRGSTDPAGGAGDERVTLDKRLQTSACAGYG